MTTSIRARSLALADRCADAYSAGRYASWPAVAAALLRRGLTEIQAEAVMRSKWTRWAADHSDRPYGSAPASALIAFMDDPRNNCSPSDIDSLVAQTF